MTAFIFQADDLDWALGELLALFDRADRCGVLPHELDPELFYDVWSLLNEQSFPVRQRWHAILTLKLVHRFDEEATDALAVHGPGDQ